METTADHLAESLELIQEDLEWAAAAEWSRDELRNRFRKMQADLQAAQNEAADLQLIHSEREDDMPTVATKNGHSPPNGQAREKGRTPLPEAPPVQTSAPPSASGRYDPALPLEMIVPSATNPRKTFDEAKLAELAESIKAKGVLQPILVRPLYARWPLLDDATFLCEVANADDNPRSVECAHNLETRLNVKSRFYREHLQEAIALCGGTLVLEHMTRGVFFRDRALEN